MRMRILNLRRKYIEGDVRPVKLRLKTQIATEEILARTYHYQLRDIEKYKDVFIKKEVRMKKTQKF